jgi:hypothetical protein
MSPSKDVFLCAMRFAVVSHTLPLGFERKEDSRKQRAMTERTEDQKGKPGGTMRPVVRGRQGAVSSMKPEATDVARRILQAGGNAFDAAALS